MADLSIYEVEGDKEAGCKGKFDWFHKTLNKPETKAIHNEEDEKQGTSKTYRVTVKPN